MKKKPPIIGFPAPTEIPGPDDRHWHNGGDIEIMLYARSRHRAAMKILAVLDHLHPNPATAWDACPALFLYRQALELHLKILNGEGLTFLASPTDSITLYKTHALRWLAQIACQIVRNSGLESSFKCDGVANLSEFSALVSEVESLDPVTCSVTTGRSRRDGSVPPGLEPTNIARLARKLDALLNLLDSTADALAATTGMIDDETGHGINPTIQ
jgi:hypothetical protein